MSFRIYPLVVFCCLISINGVVQGRRQVSRVDKFNSLQKLAIKTIHSNDGDIIDCIDIHKQPAFNHHALKNHTIQMRPSFSLPAEQENRALAFQTWHESGTCPKGTVPILRIPKTLTGSSARKKMNMEMTKPNSNTSSIPFHPTVDRNLTIGNLPNRNTATLVTVGYNYIGATANINVWKPYVERPDDYSTAQIWLQGGPGDNFESVEAGWAVNPTLYGDADTRLFVYWTKDAYKTTGCFNLFCPGFVQTSDKVIVGAKISPISSEHQQQYDISISIIQDQATTNWWLKFEDETVGYWPGDMFGYLKQSATLVQWGGQVYSEYARKTPHTATAMGSGSSASGLFGTACYISQPRIMDYSLSLKYPDWVASYTDNSQCYGCINYREGIVGEPVFYFGGSGRSPSCP